MGSPNGAVFTTRNETPGITPISIKRLVIRVFPLTEITLANLPTGTVLKVATSLLLFFGDISLFQKHSTLIENRFQFHLLILTAGFF